MTSSNLKHFIIAQGLILLQAPNVHMPDVYGEFLAESIQLEDAKRACDLTTGCGYHALSLAARGIETVAIDKSTAAVSLARRNSALNGLDELVDVRCGDLYSPLGANERFDCIVAWPPVMPTPAADHQDDWWSMANNGGPQGRDVYDRVIAGAPGHLTPRGALWLVHPWYLSFSLTQKLVETAGLGADRVATRRFPLGPVSRSRLPYLASIGFVPVYQDNEPMQELTILRISRHWAPIGR